MAVNVIQKVLFISIRSDFSAHWPQWQKYSSSLSGNVFQMYRGCCGKRIVYFEHFFLKNHWRTNLTNRVFFDNYSPYIKFLSDIFSAQTKEHIFIFDEKLVSYVDNILLPKTNKKSPKRRSFCKISPIRKDFVGHIRDKPTFILTIKTNSWGTILGKKDVYFQQFHFQNWPERHRIEIYFFFLTVNSLKHKVSVWDIFWILKANRIMSNVWQYNFGGK